MKSNELIDATIGMEGAMAQMALYQLLGENGFAKTMVEVKQLLAPVTLIEGDDKLQITLNKDQGRMLASFFVMGLSLMQAICEGERE